ncbi:MAG: ATP-binding protein [Bacilli bacterium]|jgi:hypothetical protein
MIKRDKYLNQLITAMKNGMPKVITGIRRSGKSYLLKNIFRDYLLQQHVQSQNIISIELDDIINYQYRNPLKLTSFIRDSVAHLDGIVFVFIDEVQLISSIVNPELTDGKIVLAKKDDSSVISFVDVVLGLSRLPNVDLYVTGSNSKLLSKDVFTEFRDKATNIHVLPLSFEEYYDYIGGDEQSAFYEYLMHGGMPLCVLKPRDEKEKYLKELFSLTYFKDILEHNSFKKAETLDEICDVLSSMSGQLLNSQRIAHIVESRKREKIDKGTVDKYIEAFVDSYIISEAKRYDIKGTSPIGATRKYYFQDTGLRNARLDFASPDFGQMIETAIYNELIYRGYNVRVGSFDQVEKDENGKSVLKSYEVDFYATKGIDSLYIQATDNVEDESTLTREQRPFKLIRDSVKKMIIVNRPIKPIKMADGIIVEGVVDFLLDYLK